MARDEKAPRIGVFVDWCNLGEVRSVIDYGMFKTFLQSQGKLRGVHFYTVDLRAAIPEAFQVDGAFETMLRGHGFTVHKKALKYVDEGGGRRRADGNLDVDLTIDVMDMLHNSGITVDKIILFTGDGDFMSLVKRIKRHRTKYPIQTLVIARGGHVAPRLREVADQFIPIENILSHICRPEDLPQRRRTEVIGGEPLV